jgi:hypothetical protein
MLKLGKEGMLCRGACSALLCKMPNVTQFKMLLLLQVKLVGPRDMSKLGKGGTLASRQALLHSLVVSQTLFASVMRCTTALIVVLLGANRLLHAGKSASTAARLSGEPTN